MAYVALGQKSLEILDYNMKFVQTAGISSD